jgi:hypothetical protein
MIEELKAMSQQAQSQLDDSLLRNVEGLSQEELVVRVRQLAAELNEWGRWEAIRVNAGVRAVQEELANKYRDLMSQQRRELEDRVEQKLLQVEQTLRRKHQDELFDTRLQVKEEAQSMLESQQKIMEEERVQSIERETQRLAQEHAVALKDMSLQMEEKLSEFVESQLVELSMLQRKLDEANNLLDRHQSKESERRHVHDVTGAVLAVSHKMQDSLPLTDEIENLLAVSEHDNFIESLVSAFPSSVTSVGIPTLDDLRLRFASVKQECRKAALVPDNARGMLGHTIGALFATLTFDQKGLVSGEGVEEKLARADHYLDLGNLDLAIRELDTVQGLPGEILNFWLTDARTRYQLDLTRKALTGYVSILNDCVK